MTVEGRGHAFKSFDPAQKAAIQLPVRQLERGALLGRRRRRGERFRHGDSLDRHSRIALSNGDRSKHDGSGESDTHGVANSSLGRTATFGKGPRQREAHEYGTADCARAVITAHRLAVGVAPRERVCPEHTVKLSGFFFYTTQSRWPTCPAPRESRTTTHPIVTKYPCTAQQQRAGAVHSAHTRYITTPGDHPLPHTRRFSPRRWQGMGCHSDTGP